MILKILRYLKAPFKQHRYLFDQAECVHIEPGLNPAQAYLTFEVECQYCPKKIKVDYDKYHGMIPLSEQYGCLRMRLAPTPKPVPLQFIERELTGKEIETINSINTYLAGGHSDERKDSNTL